MSRRQALEVLSFDLPTTDFSASYWQCLKCVSLQTFMSRVHGIMHTKKQRMMMLDSGSYRCYDRCGRAMSTQGSMARNAEELWEKRDERFMIRGGGLKTSEAQSRSAVLREQTRDGTVGRCLCRARSPSACVEELCRWEVVNIAPSPHHALLQLGHYPPKFLGLPPLKVRLLPTNQARRRPGTCLENPRGRFTHTYLPSDYSSSESFNITIEHSFFAGNSVCPSRYHHSCPPRASDSSPRQANCQYSHTTKIIRLPLTEPLPDFTRRYGGHVFLGPCFI
jgi:hypothetical protein